MNLDPQVLEVVSILTKDERRDLVKILRRWVEQVESTVSGSAQKPSRRRKGRVGLSPCSRLELN